LIYLGILSVVLSSVALAKRSKHLENFIWKVSGLTGSTIHAC